MKLRGMYKRWLWLLAIPLFLCQPSFGTTVKDCRDAILELAEEGPGGDWIIRDRLFQLMEQRGLEHLFYGALYQCPFCKLYNPHRQEGKMSSCESCKKKFDAEKQTVHDVEDEHGRVLVHVRSINFKDDGKPKMMEAPWICAYCRTTNDFEETKCTKPGCNHTREEGNRKVVEFGTVREVVQADNTSRGYVVDTPEDAARAREQRAKDAREQELADKPDAKTDPDSQRRWNRLYRNRIIGAVAATTIGVGTIWYGMQDPAPPVLPASHEVRTTIDSVYWEKRVLVQEFDGKNWIPLKPFFVKGDETVKPHLPPEIPPEYFTNTRKYQVEIIPYYSILVNNPRSAPVEWQISREEFHNWVRGDKVELTVMEDGAPVGIRRAAP